MLQPGLIPYFLTSNLPLPFSCSLRVYIQRSLFPDLLPFSFVSFASSPRSAAAARLTLNSTFEKETQGQRESADYSFCRLVPSNFICSRHLALISEPESALISMPLETHASHTCAHRWSFRSIRRFPHNRSRILVISVLFLASRNFARDGGIADFL